MTGELGIATETITRVAAGLRVRVGTLALLTQAMRDDGEDPAAEVGT